MKGRIEIRRIAGHILINDSYNANPDSVRALCEIITILSGEKCLVFGDMLELGEFSKKLHYKTGGYFAKAGVCKIFYFGNFGRQFINGAKKITNKIEAKIFNVKSNLISEVIKTSSKNLIFKSSQKMQLDEVFKSVAKYLSSRNS